MIWATPDRTRFFPWLPTPPEAPGIRITYGRSPRIWMRVCNFRFSSWSRPGASVLYSVGSDAALAMLSLAILTPGGLKVAIVVSIDTAPVRAGGWPGYILSFSFSFFLLFFLPPFIHFSPFFYFPIGVPGATLSALVTVFSRLILTSESLKNTIVRYIKSR